MPRSLPQVLLPRPRDIDPLLTELVAQQRGGDHAVRILDAGCGRMWTWDLEGIPMHLTGVDEDADALRLRVDERGDLDEWIVGDLRTVALKKQSYDVVHSAYVLEHIKGAEQVLDRMLYALRPGGLMVLRMPDGDSVYSFITRLAPHRLHVTYKRRIRRKPLAGTPGHGPYPVVYDDVVSLRGALAWAEQHGLEVIALYGDNSHLRFFGRAAKFVDLGLRCIAALSFGRLTARYSNLILALRKAAPRPTEVAQ